MKKKSLLLGLLCLLMIITLTGCAKKEAITREKFKTIADRSSYTVTNASTQYSSYKYIQSADIASSSDGWQVEFYVLDDANYASSMFNTNKQTFESYKSGAVAESSSSIKNYSTYTLSTNGYYMHLCRVDNTLLYVKVKDTYKDKVTEFIKQLGY